MSAKQTRCLWSQGDPLMQRYHDEEWGVPDFDSRSLWETLMLEGFQAGLSWITVLRKRDAFRKAFRKFDPRAVARLGEKDIAKMLENPGIIRSRAKIEATINGARVYLDMQAAGLEFSDFAWQFVEGKPIQNSGPVPCDDSAFDHYFKGTQAARLQIRRTHHRVRMDAGCRSCQRPRGELFSA